MSERPYDRPSIFSRVDQAGMLDRLAHSPLDDAAVGYLSDRDDAGGMQVAPALMDGIRIFAGEPAPVQLRAVPAPAEDADDATVAGGPQASADDFILFGPAGQQPGSRDTFPRPLPHEGAS